MYMKQLTLILAILYFLSGCAFAQDNANIAATTLPVYEFTSRLCDGTGLTVTRLVTENVSCLHDYTLKVEQMRAIEAADLVVINGSGLEAFLEGALNASQCVLDSSEGMSLLEGHHHDHDHEEGHAHAEDPHIWLSPSNAKAMATNICAGLSAKFPSYASVFETNLAALLSDLDKLQAYGERELSSLSCRELITFHDGFGYFAESFDLTILRAVEEESGSEASAAELIDLMEEVRHHALPAIFTERNGSVSAAGIIAAETGVKVFALDMAMSGTGYFDSMYQNIDTVKEALQ